MPKRKSSDEGQSSSIYTFRLANGDAFDVQGVKELVEQLVFKSIDYANKKALAAEEESKHEHQKMKVTRRKYSREAKKQMAELYDKYPVKEAAMEIINSLEGFTRVTPGMIQVWKKPKPLSTKKAGRKVDKEFEQEVLQECERVSNNHMQTAGSSSAGNVASTLGLTFAVVRECAVAVHERLYPDETGHMVQKWKLNKTTQKLVFSQRWVLGLLERYQKQLAGADGGSSAAGVAYDGMGAEEDEVSDSSSSDESGDEE